MRWRGVGCLMWLGAKGPPLPTIKNGLETLRRRLPTVFHGHAWSWVVLVVEVVLDSGGVGGGVGVGGLGG